MTITKKDRFETFQEDGFQCCYCGGRPPKVKLEIDHIIPKSAGGDDEYDNLITACSDCNAAKGATILGGTPEQRIGNVDALNRRRYSIARFARYDDYLQKTGQLEAVLAKHRGKDN